jgi:hypothetical protein
LSTRHRGRGNNGNPIGGAVTNETNAGTVITGDNRQTRSDRELAVASVLVIEPE